MRAFRDYENTKSYSDSLSLPKGGYVCEIKDARVNTSKNGWEHLAISMEICEGEFTGYYMDRWKNNTNPDKTWGCVLRLGIPTDDGSEKDGWTKRAFKTAIEAIEDSNNGFHWGWNEAALKGLKVGGLFRIEQFLGTDGEIKSTVRVASLTSIEKVHKGTYKLPKDKLLEDVPLESMADGFITVPDGASEDGLPFA